MLNMALTESLEDQRGLRPLDEIERFLHSAMPIKYTSPQREWKEVKELEKGGQGTVWLVRHR